MTHNIAIINGEWHLDSGITGEILAKCKKAISNNGYKEEIRKGSSKKHRFFEEATVSTKNTRNGVKHHVSIKETKENK